MYGATGTAAIDTAAALAATGTNTVTDKKAWVFWNGSTQGLNIVHTKVFNTKASLTANGAAITSVGTDDKTVYVLTRWAASGNATVTVTHLTGDTSAATTWAQGANSSSSWQYSTLYLSQTATTALLAGKSD